MNIHDANTSAPSRGGLIIYGPQGCGKTFYAPALEAYFGCQRFEDAPVSVYREVMYLGGVARLTVRNMLMLTHLAPPEQLGDCRRILHLRDAMRLAGIPTHGKAVGL
jgi:DNA polymerase III delta prime subunit